MVAPAAPSCSRRPSAANASPSSRSCPGGATGASQGRVDAGAGAPLHLSRQEADEVSEVSLLAVSLPRPLKANSMW